MSKAQFVDFEQAFVSIPVGSQKLKESDYALTGLYPVVDQGQSVISGYTNRDDGVRKSGPYILFGDHTRMVKFIDFPFVVGADGVRLYRANRGFDPEFLYLFLKSVPLPNDGYGRHSKYLSDVKVPNVHMDEQRHIVAHLKALLTEVETAHNQTTAQLGEARKLTTKLREKIVLSLLQVQRQPLGNLLLGIEAGKSFQTSDRLANEHELGVLKVSAVSWSEFNPNEAKAIDGDYQPDGRQRVRAGDILISRANTVELVGAVVQVDEDYPNRLLSDKTLRLLPDVSRISADFLVHILKLPEARSHIESNATGTSDSMRNISQKTISNIPIPVPEAAIQHFVALQLSEIERQSRKIENTLRTILSDIGCLPGKLLAQAFEQ